MNKITENILSILEEILDSTEIVFSRASLSQKIYRFGGYDAHKKKSFDQAFQRYEKTKYIKRVALGSYKITEKGIKKINEFKIKRQIFNKDVWDGLWRIIIFDIPEEKKWAREAIRKKMKLYNFFPLQKSVFVCPYDCGEAIQVLSEYFMVSQYVDLIIASKIGKKEKYLLKYFDL